MSNSTLTAGPAAHNPYLEGGYAPVDREITAIDLDVTGRIPDHLDGRYLRNGPNALGSADPAHYHLFLGPGMVHGLRLRDGRAQWYRNRWVRSADVSRRLGETWPGGARGGFDFGANTNVIGHAGRTLALAETGVRPYELTDELDTVGGSDFCGTLFTGYTAHPKRDPATGELHAVSYNPMRGNLVQYTVTGADGTVRRTVDIPLRAQTMMHDFSLTEKYVILYDLPVVLDLSTAIGYRPAAAAARWLSRFVARHRAPDFVLRAAMRGTERGGAPSVGSFPYRWAPERRAQIGVLPRDGKPEDIRWFEVSSCYVFHPLNAYDEADGAGDRIVLDVVRHESVFAAEAEFTDARTLDRWTVDLAGGLVREERLDDTAQEFPRVDERLVGRRHRYGYAVGYAPGTPGITTPQTILRHDLCARTTRAVDFGPGREPGEFVFVPSGPDAAEDDGVVMGFVYDHAADRSDLVLLDAQTLDTVATVHVPVRVPHGFHGNWVDS